MMVPSLTECAQECVCLRGLPRPLILDSQGDGCSGAAQTFVPLTSTFPQATHQFTSIAGNIPGFDASQADLGAKDKHRIFFFSCGYTTNLPCLAAMITNILHFSTQALFWIISSCYVHIPWGEAAWCQFQLPNLSIHCAIWTLLHCLQSGRQLAKSGIACFRDLLFSMVYLPYWYALPICN